MRLLPLLLLPVAALVLGADETRQLALAPAPDEFHFARMIYVDAAGGRGFGRGFGRGWWRQDWPEAEDHFTQNLKRLTRVSTGESVTIDLTDDSLFDYPSL
jgi:hypothetical protein